MFKLIDEAESKRYRSDCAAVLNTTCQALQEKGISAQFTLVGSGARNLVTRNGNAPYDLDYNMEILKADKRYLDNLSYLKETIRVELNNAEGNTFFRDAHDSTSVLTSILHFTDEPSVKFSFDVAITMKNSAGTMCRLIHNKNAWGWGRDQYTWCEVPSSKNVLEKAAKIKQAGLWPAVRKRYVDLKNLYLERQDDNHPSFVVYVEAVNEVYSKLQSKAKSEKAKSSTAKVAAVLPKTEFNCKIQQILSKTKQYDGKTISQVSSLACSNYDGKKSKKTVQNELQQKYGAKTGNDLYTRILKHLK